MADVDSLLSLPWSDVDIARFLHSLFFAGLLLGVSAGAVAAVGELAVEDTVEVVAGEAEPVVTEAEPVAEKVTKRTEPVVEPVTKSAEPVVRNVTKGAEPVVRKATKGTKPVVEPVTKAVEPVVEKVTKAVEPVVEPIRHVVAPALDQLVELSEPVVGQPERSIPVVDQTRTSGRAPSETSAGGVTTLPPSYIADPPPVTVSLAADTSASPPHAGLPDAPSRESVGYSTPPHALENLPSTLGTRRAAAHADAWTGSGVSPRTIAVEPSSLPAPGGPSAFAGVAFALGGGLWATVLGLALIAPLLRARRRLWASPMLLRGLSPLPPVPPG